MCSGCLSLVKAMWCFTLCVCLCVCLLVCEFATMSVQMIWLRRAGTTQTMFYRNIGGMRNYASYVSHTHILMIISWCQKGLKLAITWSVFVVQRGYKYCRNIWLVGHLSNTLGFLFRFETSSEVENENRFREFSKSLFCTRKLQLDFR